MLIDKEIIFIFLVYSNFRFLIIEMLYSIVWGWVCLYMYVVLDIILYILFMEWEIERERERVILYYIINLIFNIIFKEKLCNIVEIMICV